MSDADATRGPAQSGTRIDSLDFIRGIAVLGILAANIVAFGQPFLAYMWPQAFLTEHGTTSDWLWVGQFILVDGKMRGLFTLLFGAGMALFMERAWARGDSRWLQVRRLVWLLLFGLMHYFLIWRGDILLLYAMIGFVAVLFLKLRAKTQLWTGLFLYLFGGFFYGIMFGPTTLVADTSMGESAEFVEMRAELEQTQEDRVAESAIETEILTEGTYWDQTRHMLSAHTTSPLFLLLLFGFETLPLMLIGMAFYRSGFFSGGPDPGAMLRWGLIGVVVGTVLTAAIGLWVKDNGFTYWGTLSAFTAFQHLPRFPVVLGLAALLTLLAGRWSGWLPDRLSAAGRMAFSNYIGTSLLMMVIFHPWGLGLFGDLNRPQLYLVVLLGWLVMLAWSKPWLAHFRYGPLEWLWRCLTYGQAFPLKR